MPRNHSQGNVGGEATGNDTFSSTGDSELLRRKRKPEFEETEINQSSQQGEQSYDNFTPDGSDGEATGLSGLEIHGYHHVFKKRKATTAGLLLGTVMEDLYVVPSSIESASTPPVMTGNPHLRRSNSESYSPSIRTRPVGHLVNDCIGNIVQATPKETGHIEDRAQSRSSKSSSYGKIDALGSNNNMTEGSFVIVTSNNGRGSQLFPARADFVLPFPKNIPATRSHIIRPSPKHKEENATNIKEVEVAENTHERSTSGGSEAPITESHHPHSADAYRSKDITMRVGGTHSPATPKKDAQGAIDIQSKADDREYEFVEHPEPRSIQKFRQVPAIVKNPPDGAEHAVNVYFDNWADSNFISSNIVRVLEFRRRPLLEKDKVTYKGLTGACRPEMYVSLELRHRGVSKPYKESFRVVENDDFELIVGAAAIEERGIRLQEPTEKSAFPSFKKQPTKEQTALQQASRKQDQKVAIELSKNIPPYNNKPLAPQNSRSAKEDERNTPNSSKNRQKG